MLGPSLTLCFEDLWLDNPPARTKFWELAFELSSSVTIPEISKLIAPSTITNNSSLIEDFLPLLDKLSRDEKVFNNFLEHLVIALLIRIDDGEFNWDDSTYFWAEFAYKITENINQKNIYSLRMLLWKLTEIKKNINMHRRA